MRIVILLGTAAITLSFIVSIVANLPSSGRAVAARFLERTNSLPKQTEKPSEVTVNTLRDWITEGSTSGFSTAYAWKVIPLDFLFLISLGCFLGVGSSILASMTSWPAGFSKIPLWVWWCLPALYMLADACEDTLIMLFLNKPMTITTNSLDLLTQFRSIKIWTNVLATVQVFLLGLGSYVLK